MKQVRLDPNTYYLKGNDYKSLYANPLMVGSCVAATFF